MDIDTTEKKNCLNLPEEILIRIFNILKTESKDKLNNQLMLVCKRFKEVIENYFKFKSTFFHSTKTDNCQEMARTNAEIEIFGNSRKKIHTLTISAEMDFESARCFKSFMDSRGEFVKSVTIYCNAEVNSIDSLHEILSVISCSVENISIYCKKFVSSYNISRSFNKCELQEIHFPLLKSLSIVSDFEDQKLINLNFMNCISAPSLKSFYFTDVRFKDLKIFDALRNYKSLTKVYIAENHYKWAKTVFSFEFSQDQNGIYLILDHCSDAITSIEDFLKIRGLAKIKGCQFNDYFRETDSFDNFFNQIKYNLKIFDTTGYFVENFSRKFKFPELTKLTIKNFHDIENNIRRVSAAFYNVKELNIFNYRKNLPSDIEIQFIRLYFRNLGDWKPNSFL